MPSLRSSPSGPAVVIGGSSDIENLSLVAGATLTQALGNLIAPETVTLYDDFVAGGIYNPDLSPNGSLHIGELNWVFHVAGATQNLSKNGNGQDNFLGLYYWTILASGSNRGSLILGAPSLTAESVERVIWRSMLNMDPTFTSSRRVGLGVSNGANLGGDAICFEHQAATGGGVTGSPNVQCVAYKGGVRSAVISSIATLEDTFMIFELRRRAALTWDYYVNGVLAGTQSGAVIPTVKLTPAAQGVGVVNTVTSMGVDTFEITYRRKRSVAV